jgi:hypothetical protein
MIGRLKIPLLASAVLACATYWIVREVTRSEVSPSPAIPESASDAVLIDPGRAAARLEVVPQGDPSNGSSERADTLPVGEDLSLSLEEQEEAFKWLRQTTATADLLAEQQKVWEEMVELASAQAHERLEAGEYERLLGTGVPTKNDGREHLVDFFAQLEDGQTVRVSIPEALRPDVYALRRRSEWIIEMVEERRAIEAGE